ncbi:MAG: DUF998 domain-containing protein [Deltaproteobacteria bacterium]|jgi:hypothetical membrane protein|nr:DUF998 domain-containing protein [Deltaproteobacteria bacterium]MBW2686343.1 DUF998 domain-containing protein [Deltaproteobacteria bacterium]
MNDTVNRWPAAAGLFAAPFYLTLIFALGALEPGFSHLSTPMSMLGGVPGVRGMAFNLGVATTGVLVIAFGIGLRRQLPPKMTAKVGFALLAIGGLGLNGAAYFHCNEGCRNILTQADFVGRLHIVSSLLAGMGTGLAPIFVWAAMRGSEDWKGLATPTLVTALLANLPGITFWITIATDFRLYSIEGLIQRLGFVVVLIWIFVVAARLWWMASTRNDGTGL